MHEKLREVSNKIGGETICLKKVVGRKTLKRGFLFVQRSSMFKLSTGDLEVNRVESHALPNIQ